MAAVALLLAAGGDMIWVLPSSQRLANQWPRSGAGAIALAPEDAKNADGTKNAWVIFLFIF